MQTTDMSEKSLETIIENNSRKHEHTTLYKSNSGWSFKFKVSAFNKLWWWRTGGRFEIRYCSYT